MDFTLASTSRGKAYERAMSSKSPASASDARANAAAEPRETRKRRAFERAIERARTSERSLMMFDSTNVARVWCRAIVSSTVFTIFIAATMAASAATAAVVAPKRDGTAEEAWVTYFGYATIAVFALECVMKVIAQGFAFGEGAYLKSPWNQFDFLLVTLSIILAPIASGHLTVLRLLRALQPLRMFAKYRSGRLVIRTMARALPLLGDVGLFFLWFIIVFAIAAVTLFGGRTSTRWYTVPEEQALNETFVFPSGSAREICATLEEEWLGDESVGSPGTYPDHYASSCVYTQEYTNRSATEYCCDSRVDAHDGYLNFDNAGRAGIIALNAMTIDGWNELLNELSYAVGFAPSLIWFGFVVVIGGFFVMELFTSVICATLTQMNVRDEEEVLQESMDSVQEHTAAADRDPAKNPEEENPADAVSSGVEVRDLPTNAFRLLCLYVVSMPWFNNFITTLIVLNTILMMAQHHNQIDGFTAATTILEVIFLSFFVLEMVIKHIGSGFRGYWRLKENWVDGFIVVTGVVSTIAASQGFSLSFLRILRIFRAFRTMRVIRQNRELRKIVASAMLGLKDMWPFLIVWLILTVIFAIFGFQLFSGLGTLDEAHETFRNFLRSALTLFIISTGEDSFSVAWSTMVAYGSNWIILYTICWIFVSTIILSLVLGILIDSCSLIEVEDDKMQHKEVEEMRLKEAIERAETRILSKDGRLKRILQNATFALAAMKSGAKNKDSKFMRRGDVLNAVKEDIKVTESAFPKVKHMKDNALDGRANESTRRLEEDNDDGNITEWPMSSQSLEQYAKDTKGMSSPVRRGKLAEAKARRARKNGEDDVNAVRIFLISIDFMQVEPGRTLTMSEHALEAARLRLTPPLSKDSIDGKIFRDSVIDTLKKANGRKSDSYATKTDEGNENPELAGPWAQAVFGPKIHVVQQSNEIPGVIITSDGDMIPTFDTSIPMERYKQRVYAFITHRWVENFILLIIISGSILLATETHTWPSDGSKTAKVYKLIEIISTAIFGVELLLKLFALGLYKKRTAYIRNAFNVLDLFVVLTSVVTLVVGGSGGAVRSLRLLRILRPLRSIRRLPGLRLIIMTIIAAIPAVSYVLLLGIVSMSIFALLGMELFMGKMWSCYLVESARDYATKATCQAAGGVWRNARFNFDNFGAALLSTFMLHVGDDWQEIMWVAMDITGTGTGLQANANQFSAFYFVATVAFGNFFWMNLLVTALIDNFNKMTVDDKLTFVTPSQRRWQQALLRASAKDEESWRYISPSARKDIWSRLRNSAHLVCKQKIFDYVMLFVVSANVIELLTQTVNMSQEAEDAHFYLSIGFTAIYALEMILLLMAQGFRRYFAVYWNWLDAFVVFVAIIQAIGQGANLGASVFEYLQLFRLLRLLKLVKAHSGLRSLFNTFIMSLPGVLNVAALSLLVLFSFAICGVALFGGYTGPYEGGVLSKYANFETFGSAMVSLFAVYTGGWVGTFAEVYLTEACLRTKPPFVPESSINCSYNYAAIVFFIFLILITLFLLGNLFVAIILERFTVSSDAEGLYDHAEVVEIIKHTIQLRKLALKIKLKAVKAREPGGALYEEPKTLSWKDQTAQRLRATQFSKLVKVIGSRGSSKENSLNESERTAESNPKKSIGLAAFRKTVDQVKENRECAALASKADREASDDDDASRPVDANAFLGTSRFGAAVYDGKEMAESEAKVIAESYDDGSIEENDGVDDDDDYYYGFSTRSRVVAPTPADTMSERSFDDGQPADQTSADVESVDYFATPMNFRFNVDGTQPHSALQRHLAQQERDYLMAFRDDGTNVRPVRPSSLLGSENGDYLMAFRDDGTNVRPVRPSSLVGSENGENGYFSDGDATYTQSEPMSDSEFAELSFRL